MDLPNNTAMDAETYIAGHWKRRRIWTHLRKRKHARRLARCARAMEGETYADVGCAMGHSTAIMAETKPGNWTGIDFSLTAIRGARRRFPDGFQFIYCADVASLAGTGLAFDGVVCSEVIEHVTDDAMLAEGLKAITQKVLIVTTPSVLVNDPAHVRLYDAKMLTALFPGAKIEEHGPFWYVIWRPS